MKKLFKLFLGVAIVFLVAGYVESGGFSFLTRGEEGNVLFSPTVESVDLGQSLAEYPEESLLWGYHQLTPEEQEMYRLLRDAAGACYEERLPCTVTLSSLDRVLEALAGDHPELFWFRGDIQYYYPSDGSPEFPDEVQLKYIMDRNMIPGYQDVVRRYVENCLLDEQVAAAQTDFDKIVAVYQYIIDHTIYVEEKDDQSVITLMTEGKAVCAGYSDSFQLIMHHLGLPCYSVSGHGFEPDGALSDMGHSWNTVQCDGVWYNVDATWGDPLEMPGVELEGAHHGYLLVNDALFYRDHAATSLLGAPTCDSMVWNYHNRYSLLFATWDPEIFRWAVDAQLDNNLPWAEVRYDNYEAYDTAKANLIDGGLLGEILLELGIGQENSDGSITYTYRCDDNTGVISLKLIY